MMSKVVDFKRRVDLREAVQRLMAISIDKTFVIGPQCWREAQGRKINYFMLGLGDLSNQFYLIELSVDGEVERQEFIRALAEQRGAMMIDTDAEMRFIQWCESLWPGEKVSALRKKMEASYH